MIRIGISGWRYSSWRGIFYPPRMPQRKELEFASRAFPSIEINGTFYSLQRPEFFQRWADETPADFVFAIKGSRFITHMRKLLGVETALANFFASGMLALGPKLGPVLWQLPPQMKFNADRLESFFKLLPRSTFQAAKLARKCDDRMLTRAYFSATVDAPLRHALEIRHDSFATAESIDLLRKYDIALVIADTVEWPILFDVTTDFVYIRLHGSEELYASGYEPDAIDLWTRRIIALATGARPDGFHVNAWNVNAGDSGVQDRDVYVYFDNDMKVRAPMDAQALMRSLQLPRTL